MIKELIKLANELKLADKNEKSLTPLFEILNKGPAGRHTLWLCSLNIDQGQTIESLTKVLRYGWEKEDCLGNLQNPCGIKKSEAGPDLLWALGEITKFYGIEAPPLNGGQLEYFSIGLAEVCDDGSPTPL